MLLGRLRIRGKLALLVTVPLVCMVTLTVPVVWERVGVAQRAGEIESSVQIAGRVGTLLQQLQRERLLAVGVLLGHAPRTDLVQQITMVDDEVADLRADLGDDLPDEVDAALDGVRQLTAVRTAMLAGQASPERILAGYRPVNLALIESLRLRQDVDTRSAAGRQVLALDGILRNSEGLSTGGALIVLVADRPTEQLATAYVANMAVLQQGSEQTLGLLTAEQLDLLVFEQLALADRTSTGFIEQSAADPLAAVRSLKAENLFPTISSLITLGQFVEKKLVADITAEVRAEQDSAISAAVWVGVVINAIVLAVILLALAIGRAVARPLTRLTVSADRVARVAESELVRVSDDEAESAQPIRLDPVDVAARDEVGDLARAFERVQSTAARLVERQVASRRNVAQMFGHVGRRTQNLVGRQLALIDRLERQEADPGRLEHLYRLDHISSRLRRNAGSLVVLSGATGDDAHIAPVPLADVVRLALGEIEDYTRVDVQFPAGVSAAPAVVGDLVLTLAELMENATVFSPPHTRVTVSGELTEKGATLSVVDHGIGMKDDRLAEENARLTRRERLDLAPTEVLGLFVVGRLARRHGWSVALVPTTGGGVTATLEMTRSSLVVDAGERPGTPAAARAALPARAEPTDVTSRRRPDPELPRAGRALAVVGAGPSRPVIDSTALPGFDPTLLSRATRSLEAAESWDAFGTVEPDTTPEGTEPETDPVTPPVDAPPAEPVRARVLQIAPDQSGRATRMTGIRQRVPGASLPKAPPRVAPVDATGADPAAARALVEQFESGVRRAHQQSRSELGALPATPVRRTVPAERVDPAPRAVPADRIAPVTSIERASPRPPARSGETPKLTRRVPGANLTVSPPRQAPPENPGDPAEVRDLINAFETGVARALREVRPSRETEEGTTR
ncbi:nitrate- and nitrite sensing domain-containing protein [Micromonospora sp. SH-82]|uniref:sensor histidine kinase n=1 Tax=Micromonospora sp. SH-82 TaxID=3132938 RepID=UPI003EC105D6